MVSVVSLKVSCLATLVPILQQRNAAAAALRKEGVVSGAVCCSEGNKTLRVARRGRRQVRTRSPLSDDASAASRICSALKPQRRSSLGARGLATSCWPSLASELLLILSRLFYGWTPGVWRRAKTHHGESKPET